MKTTNEEVLQALWKKYSPIIALKIKQTVRTGEATHIGMYAFEFHTHSGKKISGHQFDFDLSKGKLVSNISKSEAARELTAMMKNDYGILSQLESGLLNFKLDGKYMLSISKKIELETQ